MKSRAKLMIPGPVDIWDETLEALGQQVIPNYGPEWNALYGETIDLLQQVFQTKNDIIIMTSPGSGALETGLASLFTAGEKIAVVSNGHFANRLLEIMLAYRYQAIIVEDEWGKASNLNKMQATLKQHPDIAGIAVVANETSTGVRNPVRELAELAHERDVPIFVDAVSAMGGYSLPVDAWELDVVCTSSNKALEMAPGLGILSVSERAWELVEAKKDQGDRGWYYNLSNWKWYRENRPTWPYLTTVATGLVLALRASLKRIVEVETLAGHWARYAWTQKVVRAGLRNIGFEMLAEDEVASFTVTTVCKRHDMADVMGLQEYMFERHGFLLATVMGPLADGALRISHMGQAGSRDYLVPCLLGIEDFVRSIKGVDIPHGASLIGLGEDETWY
jgi:aspartate aminotransferase-like enzyme